MSDNGSGEVDAQTFFDSIHNEEDGNAWLDRTTELQDQIAELEEKLRSNERDDEKMKWRVVDEGLYSSVGRTIKTLEPGVYDIVVDSRGNVYWQRLVARDEEIIRFPEAPIDEVVDEITRFWDREAKFKQYGLPFKRGILLWGPPGSGKSCTLQLVAREMVKRGGYVVQFTDVERFVSGYRVLRAVQPDAPMVVLMEDLDEILKGKTSSGESRLLNLLDGIESTHNVVFLATTNFPKSLGDRITNRPSRFDHRIKVPHPAENARRMYLESLVREDDTDPIDVEQYVKDTGGLSLAHVKEAFVAIHILGEDYDETMRRLQKMKYVEDTVNDGDEWEGLGRYV